MDIEQEIIEIYQRIIKIQDQIISIQKHITHLINFNIKATKAKNRRS